MEVVETREQRGLAIAALCKITPKDGYWLVPSQSGSGQYRVNLDPPDPSTPLCTCPDFEKQGKPCKHVFAVQFTLSRETNSDGTETVTETLTLTREQTCAPRPTYKQDWPAYNKAQTTEKAKFQALLHDLCTGIAEPDRPRRKGMQPMKLADVTFAAVFKVFSTVSGRRFSCDLADAFDKGYLSRLPHYNTVFSYLENPALTPILRTLIAESSKPLASVEVDFATDSSGFTTCRFETWIDHKYGTVRRQHEWVKVHVMTGVKTNVVTAVEIRDKNAQDAPLMPDLINATAENFTMREISADKAYASLNNYAVIEGHGAMPYIPFKSIHTGAGGGLWAKMYHYFNYNRDDFLLHYHKRSNVETAFSMMKAKFGDAIRSKTDVAMVNEALCKILCHNVCCLIQALYELGIVATFWGRDAEPTEEPEALPEDEMIAALAWV